MSDQEPSWIAYWDYLSKLEELGWDLVGALKTTYEVGYDDKTAHEHEISLSSLASTILTVESGLRDEVVMPPEFEQNRPEIGDLISSEITFREEFKKIVVLFQQKKRISSIQINQWVQVTFDLGEAYSAAAMGDAELRSEAYQRGIKRARDLTGEEPKVQESTSENTLNRKQLIALEFIRLRGPIKGILVANHVGIEESTFRKHYVPELRKHGIKNEGDGYFFDSK